MTEKLEPGIRFSPEGSSSGPPGVPTPGTPEYDQYAREQMESYLRVSERERTEFRPERGFSKMTDDLRNLEGLTKKIRKTKQAEAREGLIKERTEIRERLAENYEGLMVSQLQHHLWITGEELSFRNPYPYESPRRKVWFLGLQEEVERLQREKWVGKESKIWFKRLESDLKYGTGLFQILEGMGSIMPFYHDGKLMMKVLRTLRSNPNGFHYRWTFARELKGLTLSGEEVGLLRGEAQKGIRERAVEFQSDWRNLSMAVAAVDQSIPDKPPVGLEKKWNKPVIQLSPQKAKFIERVFGELAKGLGAELEGHRVLNWFNMPYTEKNRNIYSAIMEAMIALGSRKEFARFEADYGNEQEVLERELNERIISKISEYAQNRLDNWDRTPKGLDKMLSQVVVRAGIVMDIGHMSASNLTWGWKLTEEGWKMHIGGLYNTTDITTPKWYAYHAAYYDSIDRNHTQLLLTTSEKFRERLVKENTPFSRLPLEEYLAKDTRAREIFERHFGDSPKAIAWRERMGWSVDPEILKIIKEMAWPWEIAYPTEDDKNEIVLVMVMPPEITTLNFWQTFDLLTKQQRDALDNEGKIRPKVWEQLGTGEIDLADFPWEELVDQVLDYWYVSNDQMSRLLDKLVDTIKKEEEERGPNLANAGNLREDIKRIDLGMRVEFLRLTIDEGLEGEKEVYVPGPVFEAAYISYIVAAWEAYRTGIIGRKERSARAKDPFGEAMAEWIIAASYLTDVKDDKREAVKTYKELMQLMMNFNAEQFARVSGRAGDVDYEYEEGMIKRIKEHVNRY